MGFENEASFEEALVSALKDNGWRDSVLHRDSVLKYPSEEDLIRNWAEILFVNNREIDRLNEQPLTEGETRQLLEHIKALKTPLRLNGGFLMGQTVTIKRDNPEDKLHFGKEISLRVFHPRRIQSGDTCYQIVRQPRFSTPNPVARDRRGDVMLLINGLPVVHIELKNSGVPISKATSQIETYSKTGVFTGLFSLIQIFVAMTPEKMLYCANPGMDGEFYDKYWFQWADFNNEPLRGWKEVVSNFLSIPPTHQMVGSYMVADEAAGVLKVMRSYQVHAAKAISDKVKKTRWFDGEQLGGYVWHTTGSGKTLTSFKSAQLIAESQTEEGMKGPKADADKVVFLVDRIELGTQSLAEYRNFASAGLDESQTANTVQETEDTRVLIDKLKSPDPANTLIVTSIQKASNIGSESGDLGAADLAEINRKRIVFIVDECHRSTFGDWLKRIKNTFPNALFFGFTGTPIYEENKKSDSTTATIFGNELHRYGIADGLRDGNVLGFDPYKVMTFRDGDVRKAVALQESRASSVEEALADPQKKKIYTKFMDELPFAPRRKEDGSREKGVEDYLPTSQYDTEEHRTAVVDDILDSWSVRSKGGKFHAIFATSSIPEAIEYYRLFKIRLEEREQDLKFTALFDPSYDFDGGTPFKEAGLNEIVADYDERYDQTFKVATFAQMKRDIGARLAHKAPYQHIDKEPEKQLDLLIVVDQMLTGFDSRWVNTLYLDKVLEYEGLIQAFSRTNRVFPPDKPHGVVVYYRRPHTMEKNIEEAIKLYSGDKPFDLFVPRLPKNLEKMNKIFGEIREIFEGGAVDDFSRVPAEPAEQLKFVALFNEFSRVLKSAEVQGFVWNIEEYAFTDDKTGETSTVGVDFDRTSYLALVERYKELAKEDDTDSESEPTERPPFDIQSWTTSVQTDRIDAEYMNERFKKYLKTLHTEGVAAEELAKAEKELHKSFATLSQTEQKFANLFLNDVQRGDVTPDPAKTFRDYIAEYMARAQNERIARVADAFGLDAQKLRALVDVVVDERSLDEYDRFDKLIKSVDFGKARSYVEQKLGRKLRAPEVHMELDRILRRFILQEANGVETEE